MESKRLYERSRTANHYGHYEMQLCLPPLEPTLKTLLPTWSAQHLVNIFFFRDIFLDNTLHCLPDTMDSIYP